jgi:hypothetical protein
MPLYGAGAHKKTLALFPRRINGQFVMMSRIDGWSNYIMYSSNLNVWENPVGCRNQSTPGYLFRLATVVDLLKLNTAG